MTRFVAIHADSSTGRLLPESVPVPDLIFVVHQDMTGEHFLHLPRALPFDRGHDWSVMGNRVRLSPAILGGMWFVFQYGPDATCDCGGDLPMGSRFCMDCGSSTTSIVEKDVT